MKSPALKTVEKIDGELSAHRQDAGEKWNALQAAQTAVHEAVAAGQPVSETSDLFKALDDAGKAYGEVQDRIHNAETSKATVIQSMAHQGITPDGGDGGSQDDYAAELRDLLRAGGVWPGQARRTPGQAVAEGDVYKQLLADGGAKRLEAQRYGADIPLGEAMDREQLAALLTGESGSSAGAFVTPDRQGYYPLPLRPLTVLDLITIGRTDSDLVEFVRMLSLTNAAAETAEAISAATIDGTTVTAVQGGRKPESAMTFEVVQEAISTIAHWVPATKRALSDAGQLRTIIDGALTWGLGDRLERQIVAGNGVGENLLGLLEQSGMNAIPAGTKSHADKIHNGITQIRLDGFNATGVIMNPLDAETVWLSRENTGGAGTGAYLFGAPNNPGPRTLWGLPVAETPACPQGTALVGNLRAAIFWLREGAQVVASDSHVDFFTRNLVAVLAEMRGGFGVPTPQAFAEVNLAAS